MTGRGGYYGSFHPAYQVFPEHSAQNVSFPHDETLSAGGHCGLQPNATNSTSVKLDEILSLLQAQDSTISSLASEVNYASY